MSFEKSDAKLIELCDKNSPAVTGLSYSTYAWPKILTSDDWNKPIYVAGASIPCIANGFLYRST